MADSEARSFETADELGITEPQRGALLEVLVLLETGKLVHVREYERDPGRERSFTGHFNMAERQTPTHCGTVACIVGTAEMLGGFGLIATGIANDELYKLFYAIGSGLPRLADITPDQAAIALRSYLTTGHANWSEAVKPSSKMEAH